MQNSPRNRALGDVVRAMADEKTLSAPATASDARTQKAGTRSPSPLRRQIGFNLNEDGVRYWQTMVGGPPRKVEPPPGACERCGGSKLIYALSTDPFKAAHDIFETQTCPDCSRTCATCGGTGVVRKELPVTDPDFGKHHPCSNPKCFVLAEQRAARDAKLYNAARIPAEYDDITLESWAAIVSHDGGAWMQGKWDGLGAARAMVRAQDRRFAFTMDEAAAQVNLPPPAYSGRARSSVVFAGPNGVGKTALGVAVARALLTAGKPTLYARLAEMVDALQDRIDPENTDLDDGFGATQADVMAAFKEAPVLVLDEFNLHKMSDYRRDRVEQLVNYRYTHQLATVFTTNLDHDGIVNAWGATVGHRIHAMAHWIEIGGVELRARDGALVSR